MTLSIQQSPSSYTKHFYASLEDYEVVKLREAVCLTIVEKLANDFVQRHGADILEVITNEKLVEQIQSEVVQRMAQDWKNKIVK